MNIEKRLLLYELKQTLTLKEKILMSVFKDYTYRIYKKGIEKGFNLEY